MKSRGRYEPCALADSFEPDAGVADIFGREYFKRQFLLGFF
jgi:hypothetical protein